MTTSYIKWLDHVEHWRNCQECTLCTQRDKIVLARGVVPCDVLFLGEAPGESENSHGLPFYGPAGDKLEEILAAVRAACQVQFSVAFSNLVACFPAEAKRTADHRPEPEEIEACSVRLREFVGIAAPRLIVCVGDTAQEWGRELLGEENFAWCDVVHPAAILRMPVVQQEMATRKCAVVLRDAIEQTGVKT